MHGELERETFKGYHLIFVICNPYHAKLRKIHENKYGQFFFSLVLFY